MEDKEKSSFLEEKIRNSAKKIKPPEYEKINYEKRKKENNKKIRKLTLFLACACSIVFVSLILIVRFVRPDSAYDNLITKVDAESLFCNLAKDGKSIIDLSQSDITQAYLFLHDEEIIGGRILAEYNGAEYSLEFFFEKERTVGEYAEQVKFGETIVYYNRSSGKNDTSYDVYVYTSGVEYFLRVGSDEDKFLQLVSSLFSAP